MQNSKPKCCCCGVQVDVKLPPNTLNVYSLQLELNLLMKTISDLEVDVDKMISTIQEKHRKLVELKERCICAKCGARYVRRPSGGKPKSL